MEGEPRRRWGRGVTWLLKGYPLSDWHWKMLNVNNWDRYASLYFARTKSRIVDYELDVVVLFDIYSHSELVYNIRSMKYI